MPGKKGMNRSTPLTAARRQIWCSIRIHGRFTQADLVRTAPDATQQNVGKYVHQLVRHGYIAKAPGYVSGRVGQYQAYVLVEDSPVQPNKCPRCGQPLSAKNCFDPKEKEKEKETNKETEEAHHDAA